MGFSASVSCVCFIVFFQGENVYSASFLEVSSMYAGYVWANQIDDAVVW